jgi:2-methylisocitrate lyase-like PEP mutase family enzyme
MTTHEFTKLHNNNNIFQIGNVWDLQSATMMEKAGYKAIGTSSLAIATSLGYEDGEQMSFDELFKICKQITSKVKTPLSVDIEGGYCRDAKGIVANIEALVNIGVVGINIEDSVVRNNERVILPIDEFASLLKDITSILKDKNIDIFINARTDNFIMGLDNALEDTIKRIKSYQENGANGIFVPCIVDNSDIQKVVNATTLPLNVMTMPTLGDLKTLDEIGVKRVSQGPFVYNNLMEHFENKLKQIQEKNSFEPLF